MKTIPLVNKRGVVLAVALVDDEDYDRLSQYTWRLDKAKHTGYAVRGTRERGAFARVRMHREILGLPVARTPEVDHIDHDGLNNQRHNLRVCTRAENNSAKGPTKRNKSGYKGVYWYPSAIGRPWRATIRHALKTYYLGTYATAKDAHDRYVAAAKSFHGEFAHVD